MRESARMLYRRWCGLMLATGLCALLSGCTPLMEYWQNGFKVGPNYRRPPAAIAPDWIDSADSRIVRAPPIAPNWWDVFNDPILNSLVAAAYDQNLPLREAAFRVLAERAKLAISIGNFFPQTQQALLDYTRKGLSNTVANHEFTPQRWFNIYDLGFNLSWEVDLWGKLRRQIEEAGANLNVWIEEYDWVLVTLLADVAGAYAEVRTLQAQIDYSRTNVELQKKTLDLVTLRFKDGAVSKLDVTQAELNLAETEALIPPLEISLRKANDRLCVLLGIPAEDLTVRLGAGPIPTAPPQVAVGIPADLIRRRPDVRRYERELAAQSAKIGIADSQFYPAVVINGTIGYAASQLPVLFNDQSIFGSWGPAARWDILNYGRLLNNVRLQDALYQERAARYLNRVLVANEEIENALALFLQSQVQARKLEKAVAAARESVELVMIQYKEGKVDFNRVFILERRLVDTQINYALAAGNIALGLAEVYRALGGGWEIRFGGNPPATLDAPIEEIVPREPNAEPLEAPPRLLPAQDKL